MSEQFIDFIGLKIPIKTHPRRTRLALRIAANGEVALLAPTQASIKSISAFAKAHQAWLTQKLALFAQRPALPTFNCSAGERWPYLGQELVLQFHPQTSVERYAECLFLPETTDKAWQVLVGWYQTQAKLYLPSRFDFWIQYTGLQPTSLQIKSYKSRWGSCDRLRRIQLNWKLIAMPQWVIDYVMVHELCHLAHMNHSPAFWRLVEQHYPKTSDAKRWMKTHSPAIMRQLTP
ncbi:M48 family metallopeptidase [Thiomicrospira microaerophila]|uniref:M48 family metallopeptidase n=1 Tax=Thiomicrospira microaerophila TaxID=406020 RepID=UPI0020102364|nr:SprT family zinc-dependent metalloprotease [Thiomicrospira microaerophila]UQB42671.1 M48 family metallopeptidase [Thiomicrospira microaerophila]